MFTRPSTATLASNGTVVLGAGGTVTGSAIAIDCAELEMKPGSELDASARGSDYGDGTGAPGNGDTYSGGRGASHGRY